MSEAVGGEDTSDNRTVSHSDEPADSRAKSNTAAQGQKETNSKEQKSSDGNTPPTKSISTSVQYQLQSVEDLRPWYVSARAKASFNFVNNVQFNK